MLITSVLDVLLKLTYFVSRVWRELKNMEWISLFRSQQLSLVTSFLNPGRLLASWLWSYKHSMRNPKLRSSGEVDDAPATSPDADADAGAESWEASANQSFPH